MCSRWNVNTFVHCIGIFILWLSCINSVDCGYWTSHTYQNLTRNPRQIACKRDEVPCRDGSCIKDEFECDGKPDCADGSDETLDCKGIICRASYGYKCDYGACVQLNARCNGIKECMDNSDEAECVDVLPKPVNDVCNRTEFHCGSGECIDDVLVCNGVANCADNSDETKEECKGLNCINTFRCKYGACVDQRAKCNGKKECFDGSDEDGCTAISKPTPKPPVVTPKPTPAPVSPKPQTPGSCLVPKVPANGKFIKNSDLKNPYKAGDYMPPFNALVTECEKQYRLSPPTMTFPICLNGKWSADPHQCVRFCKSANSTKSTKYTCRLGNQQLNSCVDPIEGTIAHIKCEPLYEGSWGIPTRICKDGTWDYPISECLPVCGQKRPKGQQLIIDGVKVVQGDYPWHIGIYRNDAVKSYICGGSILNQGVIISAAHCFADYDGNLLSKENYLVAAGKYYSPYADKRDQYAQYSTIKQIYKPERYRGPVGSFEADIAMVVLTKPFSIAINVQPVCMDWDTIFEHEQLTEHNMGVVVGWGFTKKGAEPSMELKQLETPYIPYDQCYDQVPKDFRKFLAHDKICAGYLHTNRSVCEGDSGGGLTFPKKSDDRYYLRGIVSVSPRSDASCDPDQYATYTLISKYIDFINDIVIVNRI